MNISTIFKPLLKTFPRLIINLIVFIVLTVIILIKLGVTLFTLGITFILLGISFAIVLQGLQKIPVTKVALETFFGERIPKVKVEGWRFFFLYPYVFDYILIDLIRRSPDYEPKDIRTPDNAEIKIRISITWHPNSDDANDLITFINNGQTEGVEDILGDVVGERIRQWARSKKEGPQTWEEAQGSGSKAVEAILETILARNVTEAELKECLRGNGNFKMPSLGIIIDRLNIGNIEVTGAVKEAADKKAKELQEKSGEEVEQEFVRNEIKKNMALGASYAEAKEQVQTERGKVTKNIQESKIKIDISEIGESIKDIIPSGILKNIFGNKKKGGKKI